MKNRDEFRKASRETWNRMATGWEARRDEVWRESRVIGAHMVERLDPRPGETVLELAAGVGDTGFLAAGALGPEGRLISSDFAEAMVDAARRRGDALGLRNVEYRVVDAERIPLADESVDGVLCRWGYMLMPDPAAALAETRRVLRPDGRLSFSVWGAPEQNPWATLVARVLVERGAMPPPDPSQPGIFSMADPAQAEALVRGAGFADLELEDVAMTWRYESSDDYWRFTMEVAGALSMVIAGLPVDEQEAVRDAVERAAAAYRTDDGLALPGLALNGLARGRA